MRSINIIILFMAGFLSVQCGSGPKKDSENAFLHSSDTGSATLVFTEYEHNFGKVTEGEKVAFVFTFENKGTANLVIASVTTTCGCTVPKYDTKPISPGGKGNLEVVFDTSGRNGMQTKTISVKSNASTTVVLLKIVAEVVNNNIN